MAGENTVFSGAKTGKLIVSPDRLDDEFTESRPAKNRAALKKSAAAIHADHVRPVRVGTTAASEPTGSFSASSISILTSEIS
jgi:hypothetical protein